MSQRFSLSRFPGTQKSPLESKHAMTTFRLQESSIEVILPTRVAKQHPVAITHTDKHLHCAIVVMW